MRSCPMPCSAQVRVISPSAVTSMAISLAATPGMGATTTSSRSFWYRLTGIAVASVIGFLSVRECLWTALRQLAGVLGGVLRRDPRVGIPIVLHRDGLACEVQRMEGVDHHRQLLGRLLADAGLDGARVWPVRDARGVHGERADVDATTAHEIARDVVDDLVGVDVGVVVGRGNRERVVVELTRDEAADDEVARLEGQMNRRGLVDAAGYRLEVLDVEGKGPQVAVPPDQ